MLNTSGHDLRKALQGKFTALWRFVSSTAIVLHGACEKVAHVCTTCRKATVAVPQHSNAVYTLCIMTIYTDTA